MRLIDADALMKTLKISDDCKHCEQCEYDYFCSMSGDFVSACEAINEAPSIDIVFNKLVFHRVHSLIPSEAQTMCRVWQ